MNRLFQLIQALSPKEKATFTKLAQLNHRKQKRPDYEKLFQAIVKQKEYNEKVLLLSDENYTKNFSYNKNRLTDKILEVFTIMYAENSPEMKLKRILSYLPILYKKRLWDEMNKKIKTAKKIAKRIEAFHLLIELVSWEKKYYWNNPSVKNQKFLDNLIEEQSIYLQQLQNKLEYEDLRRKIDALIDKDFWLKNEHNKLLFNALCDHPLMGEQPELICNEAIKIYHHLKSTYYRIHKQYDKAMEYLEPLVELCDKHKDLIESKEHKNILCAYLTICDVNKNYQVFPRILKKLQKLLVGDLEVNAFNTLHHLGLRYHLSVGDWDNANMMATAITDKWEWLKPHIKQGRQLAYCYNLMVLYWFLDNEQQCTYWLSQILQFEQTDKRQDIVLATRLLQLLLLYDKQHQYFGKTLETTRKTLQNNKQLGIFQKRVIQYLGKLYRQPPYKKHRLPIIEELAEELQKLPEGERALGFDEIQYWCESKLKNIPLKQLLPKTDKFNEEKIR